ncbi:MAG: NAD-dependent protein deacylase [Pseudomonadota bacterium]|nr:NAD-dependent protein deacylase [Pseudomonadota bacterium]
MSNPERGNIEQIATALRSAKRVAVITGAGMSAESGLPTYRGIGGLYNDMSVEEGLPIEEILHAYTFACNPALTWKYLAQIERACRGAQPNNGHYLLAQWDAHFDLWVITQNVDGFHQTAGSANVIELHGNLRHLFCCDCRAGFDVEDFNLLAIPPRCDKCDGLVRPDVVLFGERLPTAATKAYEREIGRGFDVIFAIGTTAAFPYIYSPVAEATARGCITVEINPDRTDLSTHVSHRIASGALAALEAIDQAFKTC